MTSPEALPSQHRYRPRSRGMTIGLILFAVLLLLGAGYWITTYLAESSAPSPDMPSPLSAFEDALGTERHRVDQLDKQFTELSDRLTAIDGAVSATQRDVADLQKRFEREAAERSAATRVSAVRQRVQPRPAPPPAPPAPAVLSVDMWGGQPSVAIMDPQGHVSFASSGDRIPGGGVIGNAQMNGQTVTIQGSDGVQTTVKGREK